MSAAAQPLIEKDDPLSPWWIRSILIVMAIDFSGLSATTMLAYGNAPLVPAQVWMRKASPVFGGEDISEGQTVFLKYDG